MPRGGPSSPAPSAPARCRASGSGPSSTGTPSSSGCAGGCATTAPGVLIEAEGDEAGSPSWPGCLADEPPPLARVRSVTLTARRPSGDAGLPHRATSAAAARATVPVSVDTATCAACLAEVDRPGRPPLPLPVHELHGLRPPLHDRARRAVRPADHDDGRRSRMCPALPGRVRRPGRPPLPRPAQRLPGRAARGCAGCDPTGDAVDGDGRSTRRSRRCAAGRSSPSRASAATTSPSTPPTTPPSPSCGGASAATTSRSR